MSNNTFQPTSFTVTSTFATLSSYLANAGFPDIVNSAIASTDGYIRNNDTLLNLYVGFGTSAPSSYEIVGPKSGMPFVAGLNANQVWLASASSTLVVGFAEGASSYVPPTVNGVIGDVTATENQVPKVDADANLVASSISDDGTAVSATEQIICTDTTTPFFETASGSTNTGYVNVKGKTSGSLKLTAADATAQIVTVTTAAQTSGASTLTIPDQAGVSSNFVFTTLAQTLTNKTLTSPVMTTPTLGVASATSLATSAATPLLLTNGQLVNVALTSQTTGTTTLTIPDFASVADEFVFKTKSVTMSNKTFVAPVLGVATGTSLAVSGLITSSGAATAIGYATGAGATVTQLTSRTTSVQIDTPTGNIVLFSAAGSATPFSFTVTNARVAVGDTIIVNQKSGTDIYTTQVVSAVGAGSFRLTLANASGTTTEQPVFNFCVLKGTAS